MKEFIERAEVVAYLRELADHCAKGMSAGFRKRQPFIDDTAVTMLAAGLMAAANQIEKGKIDTKRWS